MLNPQAGNNIGEEDMAMRIVEAFVRDNCEVTLYPILPKEGLGSEDILKEHPDSYDVIACYGGDGTLNNMVNSMRRLGIHKPIGYLPGGTTNDFSKGLEMPSLLEEKIDDIANGRPFAYDIGTFNDKAFNYVAAFGAFTKASYTTPRQAKRVLGYTAYILNGIGSAGESLTYRRHLTIEHDGITTEGTYIYGGISNAPSIGGMKFPWIQDSKLNDGLFEVLLIKAPDNPVQLMAAVNDLNSGRMEGDHITAFRTDHLIIHSDQKVQWTLDGEDGGTHQDVEITIHKHAMEIMVSNDFEM